MQHVPFRLIAFIYVSVTIKLTSLYIVNLLYRLIQFSKANVINAQKPVLLRIAVETLDYYSYNAFILMKAKC
jgi:hypothetical protein